VEQLKLPIVTLIFDVLREAGSQIGEGFAVYRADLLKYYAQARDNVKFLSTILRHFKVTMDFSSLLERRLGNINP